MRTARVPLAIRLLTVLALGSPLAACASGNPATEYRAFPSISAATSPSGMLGNPVQSPDGFSITPPARWVASPTAGRTGRSLAYVEPSASATKPSADFLDVVVTPATDDLQTLVDRAKEDTPRVLTNYMVVTDKPTMANGLPGHLLGGTYDDRGVHLQNLQLIVVNGGRSYTITFTGPASTFPALHDLALASMSSFTVS
jgi:hypothetical protein